MEEPENRIESKIEDKRERKKVFYITISVVFIICLLVIYFLNKSMNAEEENYNKSVKEMSLDIKRLKSESKELKSINSEIKFMKDSLQKNMDFLWIYKTLVQSSKLRDEVGTTFSFKPGDKVRLKMDSTAVLITDLVIGGNTFNYYIRFLVKNNKGLTSEVSPLEIERL
jgi:hypothetical protein